MKNSDILSVLISARTNFREFWPNARNYINAKNPFRTDLRKLIHAKDLFKNFIRPKFHSYPRLGLRNKKRTNYRYFLSRRVRKRIFLPKYLPLANINERKFFLINGYSRKLIHANYFLNVHSRK